MKKKLTLLMVATLTVSSVFGLAIYWLVVARHFQGTDNAYVKADNVLISPKIGGYVEALAVHDNEAVKAGQLLIRIENEAYRLKLAQIKAAYNSVEAALQINSLQKTRHRSKIAQVEAELQNSKEKLRKASADYDRDISLKPNNFVTQKQLENGKSRTIRAAAEVARVRALLRSSTDQLTILEGQAEQLKMDLEERAARVKIAELDLHDTVIRAPIDGVIGNKSIAAGQYVRAGSQIMAIVPAREKYVVANFKETQIRNMRPGQKAVIKTDAFPNLDIVGTVNSVAPATGSEFSLLPIENATGNFTKIVQRVPVKITLADGQYFDNQLKSGLSVSVDVDTREADASIKNLFSMY